MSARFPVVPDVAGVPAVLRSVATNPIETAELMLSDSLSVQSDSNQQWAIYDLDGQIAIDPDNFSAISYRVGYRVADYPIEQGGFESYDKSAQPFEVIVRLTKGGKLADRANFVDTVEALRKNLDLYMVVMPEAVFRYANVVDVSIDRSQESGAGMIIADLRFQEIRQNAVAAFSKAKDPSGVSPYNNGAVKPTAAPPNAGTTQ